MAYLYKTQINFTKFIIVVIDLIKYQGLWYEIGRLPFYFEKDCINIIAIYKLNENLTMNVTNDNINVLCQGILNIVFFNFFNFIYFLFFIKRIFFKQSLTINWKSRIK